MKGEELRTDSILGTSEEVEIGVLEGWGFTSTDFFVVENDPFIFVFIKIWSGLTGWN